MPQTKINLALSYWEKSSDTLSEIFYLNRSEMNQVLAKLKEEELAYDALVQDLAQDKAVLAYALELIKSTQNKTIKKIALHIILLSENEALWKQLIDFKESPEHSQIGRYIFIRKQPFTLLNKALSLKFFKFLNTYSPLYITDIAEICASNRWNEFNEEIIAFSKKPNADPDIFDELGYLGSELIPLLVDMLKSKIANNEDTGRIVNALLIAGYPKENFEAFIENHNDQAFHVRVISQYGHPSLLKTYRAQTEIWKDDERWFSNMLSKAISTFRTPLLIDWLRDLLCDENENIRSIAHYGIASFLEDEDDVYNADYVLQIDDDENSDIACKKLTDYWESRASEINELDKQARYEKNKLFDFGKIFSEEVYISFDDETTVLSWINSAIIYTGKHDLPYMPYGYGHKQAEQLDAWIAYFKTNPLEKGKWYRYGVDVSNVPAMSSEELKNKRFL